jgi:hypothetical protein
MTGGAEKYSDGKAVDKAYEKRRTR